MEFVKFKQINIDDPFFDTLKSDYEGFVEWFKKKNENFAFIQKKLMGH